MTVVLVTATVTVVVVVVVVVFSFTLVFGVFPPVTLLPPPAFYAFEPLKLDPVAFAPSFVDFYYYSLFLFMLLLGELGAALLLFKGNFLF